MGRGAHNGPQSLQREVRVPGRCPGWLRLLGVPKGQRKRNLLRRAGWITGGRRTAGWPHVVVLRVLRQETPAGAVHRHRLLPQMD